MNFRGLDLKSENVDIFLREIYLVARINKTLNWLRKTPTYHQAQKEQPMNLSFIWAVYIWIPTLGKKYSKGHEPI